MVLEKACRGRWSCKARSQLCRGQPVPRPEVVFTSGGGESPATKASSTHWWTAAMALSPKGYPIPTTHSNPEKPVNLGLDLLS